MGGLETPRGTNNRPTTSPDATSSSITSLPPNRRVTVLRAITTLSSTSAEIITRYGDGGLNPSFGISVSFNDDDEISRPDQNKPIASIPVYVPLRDASRVRSTSPRTSVT